MADLWAWLSTAIAPLAKRALAGLGIGWLSFTGLSGLYDQIKDAVVASWGTLPASMLQIFTLAGFHTAVGIILGALAARLALTVLSRLTRISL